VRLYQATTIQSVRRDFRLLICDQIPECFQPVFWTYSFLKPYSDGSYSATIHAPLDRFGWTGFLIELSYSTPYEPAGQQWFQISSRVVIVPDIYPFPSWGLNCSGTGASTTADLRTSSAPASACSLFSSSSKRPCLPPLPSHLKEPAL